jgi:uncharacterized membrane protein YqjE
MSDRSVSDVLQDILRNFQEIVRSEVRLAKAEVREEANKAKSASLFIGTGALSGLFAAFFLLLMAVYALATVVPIWAASLIVAIALAITATALLSAGRKRLKQVHPTPERTKNSLKENVEWAKQQTK